MIPTRRYLGAAIFRPGRTFAALAADPKRFRKGLRAVLVVGLLYAGAAALLGTGGALVTAPALAPIDEGNYYFYQMIFVLPLLLVLWLLSSGLAQGLSAALGGRAGFKTTAAGLGYAFALPALMIWVLPTAFGALLHAGMPQAEFMDLLARPGWLQAAGWAYHGLAAAWLAYLSAASLRAGHGFSRPKAVAAAIPAAALFTAGFLFFVR
jgi:hypothetical protein